MKEKELNRANNPISFANKSNQNTFVQLFFSECKSFRNLFFKNLKVATFYFSLSLFVKLSLLIFVSICYISSLPFSLSIVIALPNITTAIVVALSCSSMQ